VTTAASGVVNHRGVRKPASGMFPHPIRAVASRRFVPCVSARDVVTVASTKNACVLGRTKEAEGVGPPLFF
jgi:hypothetical protein